MQNQIIHWVSGKRLMLEIGITTLTLLLLFLTAYGLLSEAMPLVVGMLMLGTFYFLSAFFPDEHLDIFALIAAKVSGIGGAVIMNGILFSYLAMHGSKNMLQIGGLSLTAASVILFVSLFKKMNGAVMLILVRNLILMVIAYYIFMYTHEPSVRS